MDSTHNPNKVEYNLEIYKYVTNNNLLVSFDYILDLVDEDANLLQRSDVLTYTFGDGVLTPLNPIAEDFVNLVSRSEGVTTFTESSIVSDALGRLGQKSIRPAHPLFYTNTSKDIDS